MCNRIRQPAAEAPDDRGGRAGVREAVGAGVLVCRGCQPRRPAAGGRCARRACPAGKLLLPSVQTCARRRREARRAYLARKQAAGTAGGRASRVRQAVATGRRATAGGGARCRNAKALMRKGSRREPEIGRRGNLG